MRFQQLIKPLLMLMVLASSSAIAADKTVPENSKPRVLLMMSSHTSKAKGDLLLDVAKGHPFELVRFSGKDKSNDEIKAEWEKAELVLLDGINPALSKYMFGEYGAVVQQIDSLSIISLGDLDNEVMNKGVDPAVKQTIGDYFNNAGRDNYANLMRYMGQTLFGAKKSSFSPPHKVPNVGLYHPDYPGLVTADESAFYQWLNAPVESPVIAIAIHRSVVDYEQRQVIDAMINGLEDKGAKAFGFFFEGNDQKLEYPELLMDQNNEARIQLMINYRSLHYVEKRRKEFEKIGVPVIHALNYNDGDQAHFEDAMAGISPSLTPFFLVMPEDTGSIDPVVVAAKEQGIKVVMEDQINALVERAFRHARLGSTPNEKKKIATFIWNYPPGEKNIGAAFLDVPGSLQQIVATMKSEGYQVNEKDAEFFIENAGQLLRPYYRNEDSEVLIEKGLADYMPLATYLDWFEALPETVRQPIIERWGQPSENAMLREHKGQPAFVIPRMDLGNMIVLPQGVRGDNEEEHASLYHSTKTPINHAYLAIYLYAKQTFGADAFIHLGTHGSQEWLTGKERGLSVWDAPNLAVADVPVFYPYIIDNVGEAMQAKRRGRATLISHLTPGFAKAGLYAEVAQLNELFANYVLLDEGQTRANTQAEIIRLAIEQNILKDLQIDEQAIINDFESHVSKIQDHLNQLAQQSQPLGVHTFGLLPEKAHLMTTIIQMLGQEFSDAAAGYESANGLTLESAKVRDERSVTNLQAIEGYQLLQAWFTKNTLAGVDEELKEYLELASRYLNNFEKIAELDNLMNALNGEYIPVSHGNDPIRNPEAAPTGKNLIGFNPAKVPSQEAYAAGQKLMQQTIDDYRAKHGRYPAKLAFSLWSLETMRHQGALEAQILYAIGARPKWNRQGNISEIEIIPYAELKRPRVDVVVSATGLYRDAFPNVILRLAEAIDKVAKLKEDNNMVYRHAQAMRQSLLEKGNTVEDADYLSTVRIFSNDSGNYGTGLAGASLASDTWETDDKLANLYLDRMGFAFGKDESRWSENVGEQGLYAEALKGTEGVIFSRSSNLYALLTNDDPFQYFGGIGLAVRHLDGSTPEMYVSNLRRKDNLKAQTMQEFLNQEMRSRYFHPRWIKAMQDSGYAGATAILDRMNNLWGWEVMTPEAVRDDQWQEFFEVYVDDKYQMQMREFFEKHNAEALAQMIERMLEAVRKGYWQTDEKTLQKMLQVYTELANQHDIATSNEKFTDYVNEQATGFGLTPLLAAAAEMTPATPSPTAQMVSGQKLEQVKSELLDTSWQYWLWLGILVCFGAGMLSIYREKRPQQMRQGIP